MPEKRTTPRRKILYYLRVDDDDTQEILGHIVDLSAIGLQLETSRPLPLNQDFYLRIELTPELADRPFIIFVGQTKWSKADVIQPNLFRVGFEIAEIMPDDREIFLRIVAKFSG